MGASSAAPNPGTLAAVAAPTMRAAGRFAMIIAIWIITLVLLALWSVAGWGLYLLLASGTQWIGDLKPLLEQIPNAAIVERWIPGWIDALKLMLDAMQALFAWLGGAAPVLVWLIWGVGTSVLLLLALVLTMVVALIRKSTPPPTPPQQPSAA